MVAIVAIALVALVPSQSLASCERQSSHESWTVREPLTPSFRGHQNELRQGAPFLIVFGAWEWLVTEQWTGIRSTLRGISMDRLAIGRNELATSDRCWETVWS